MGAQGGNFSKNFFELANSKKSLILGWHKIISVVFLFYNYFVNKIF